MNNTDTELKSNRLALILGIIVVLVSMAKYPLKYAIGFMDKWPERMNIFYIYILVLVISISAYIMRLVFDMLAFLFYELREHDVLQTPVEIKKYEKNASTSYKMLVDDAVNGFILFLIEIALVIPGSIIWSDKEIAFWEGVATLELLVCIMILIAKRKRETFLMLKKILEYIIKRQLYIALFVLCIVISVAQSNGSKCQIEFNSSGMIIIDNYTRTFGEYSINLLDKDGNQVDTINIKQTDVISSSEEELVYYNDIYTGKSYNKSIKHWKYEYCLPDDLAESEMYCAEVTLKQDNKQIQFENEFSVKDGIYSYSENSFSKKY